MNNRLFWVDCGYACGGISVSHSGVVVEAAPIFKWMLGKSLRKIENWT